MSETWIRSVFRRSTRSVVRVPGRSSARKTQATIRRRSSFASEWSNRPATLKIAAQVTTKTTVTFQLRAGVANIQIARNERIEQLACRRARIALIGTDSVKAAASIDAALTSRHSSRRGSSAKARFYEPKFGSANGNRIGQIAVTEGRYGSSTSVKSRLCGRAGSHLGTCGCNRLQPNCNHAFARCRLATRSPLNERQMQANALRHTAATWMLVGGVDARTTAGVLGHSTPSTTLGIYAHVIASAQAAAVATIDDRPRKVGS